MMMDDTRRTLAEKEDTTNENLYVFISTHQYVHTKWHNDNCH